MEKKVEIPKCDINKNVALQKLRINPLSELSEPPVYGMIGGKPSMTAGNFCLLCGKAKSGKTWTLMTITAALINNSLQLNNIRGYLPDNKRNVLYFDTEQSTFHATRTIKRVCKLTNDPNPENLLAYGLRPLTPAERLVVIEDAINTTENLGAVIIDGIRDLLTMGINDEQEATSLTSKFLKWTAEFNIHLVIVLHQNKNDLNARGHVGTEVLNKAETIISVTKDKKHDIYVISCDEGRDITFEDFAFMIIDGLPVASDMPEEGQVKGKNPQNFSDKDHLGLLDQIFAESKKIDGETLERGITYNYSIGIVKSRDFITHFLMKQWVRKEREGKRIFYVYQRATF
jgi:AAA domain